MRGDLGTLGVILGATIGGEGNESFNIFKENKFWRNVGDE
jgi:hypothetical protein